MNDINNIKVVFEAENIALEAMIKSMDSGLVEVSKWSDKRDGVMVVSCPKMAETLAMIGAGQIASEDANDFAMMAVAGDLGHDASAGIRNARSKVKVKRRMVEQPIILASGVEWNSIIGAMDTAISYMKERIRLNNIALA